MHFFSFISEALLRQLQSKTYGGICGRGKKHSQALTPSSDVRLILKVSTAAEKNP